jgi:hypothetical protein
VSLIERFREGHAKASVTTPHAAEQLDPRAFVGLIREIEWTLVKVLLPKLQRVGTEVIPFLYTISWDDDVTPARFRHGDNVIRFICQSRSPAGARGRRNQLRAGEEAANDRIRHDRGRSSEAKGAPMDSPSLLRVAICAVALVLAAGPTGAEEYLGRLGGSGYAPDSTSNPYGRYGSRFGAHSIQNPYGRWGNRFSPEGVRNPHTMGGPRIVADDGTDLGRLNSNRFDPESVANPYGIHGSRFSPQSINNPHGRYGSRFSPLSPRNPYTATPPLLIGD